MGENIVSLKEIANILNGYAFKSSEYQDKGHRVVRITNVQKGFLIDDDPKFYNSSENLKKYELKENDILISLTGNVGRVGLVTKNILPAYLNQRVGCIRIKEDLVDNNFLFHFLNNDCFENDCINNSKGIAQLNLSTEWLKDVEIKLPSLEDQKKIAKILDKADEIRTKKKQANDKLDEFLKSTFVDMFGNPTTDKTIRKECLEKYLVYVQNGISRRRKISQNIGEIVFRIKEIRENYIDYSDVNRVPLDDKEKDKYRININELLFIRVNGNKNYVGRNTIFRGYNENTFFNDHIMRVKIDESKLNPIYLSRFLNLSFGKEEIRKYVKTSAGQFTINQQGLGSVELPIPPIEKQNKFAQIVEKVEEQKQKNEEILKQMDNLFNSLSQKAFKGDF